MKANSWEVIRKGDINYVEFTVDQCPPFRPVPPSIPALVIDGIVREAEFSADRKKLRVLITETDAGHIKQVTTPELFLLSRRQGSENAPTTKEKKIADSSLRINVPDSAADGKFNVVRHDYDYGDQALLIPRSNSMVELRAAVYLPSSTDVCSVVVFLHGVAPTCMGGPDLGWPCGDSFAPVPNYVGYSPIAEVLASHGYAVISLSGNGVLRQTSYMYGAEDFAYLILAHLDILNEANSGLRPELPYLQDRLDLQNIGLVGHSFGGEGVSRSITLNRLWNKNYGIRAVVLLGSTVVTELTIPETHTAIMLPYLDGQVSSQVGEQSAEVSRHAFNDDVLRSSILLMGENHNFFNTEWSVGAPLGWDDAHRYTEMVRHRPAEVQRIGAFYISGFFRLALGGEQQFLPLFDGSSVIIPGMPRAEARSSAYFPASSRYLVQSFETVYTDDLSSTPGNWGWAVRQGVGSIETGSPFGISRDTAYSAYHSYLHLRGEASASPAEVLLRPRLGISPVDISLYSQLKVHVAVMWDDNPEGDVELVLALGETTMSRGESRRVLRPLPKRVPGDILFLHQQITIPLEEFSIDLSRPLDFLSLTLPNGGSIYLSDIVFAKPALGVVRPQKLPFASLMDDTTVHPTGEEQEIEVVVNFSDVSSQKITLMVSLRIFHHIQGNLTFRRPLSLMPGELSKSVWFLIPAGGFHGSVNESGGTSYSWFRIQNPTHAMLDRHRAKLSII